MFSVSLFFHRFPLFRPIRRFLYSHSYAGVEKEAFGFQFRNPLGAAGTSMKDGSKIIAALSDFGYGFIEVDGNRDTIEDLKAGGSAVPVFARLSISGANLTEDEIISSSDRLFSKLYDFADAFVISRNPLDTNPLLTDEVFVGDLLDSLITTRLSEEIYKPVLVKVVASIERGMLETLLNYSRLSGIDGIIVEGDSVDESMKTLAEIVRKTSGRFPVIVSAPFTNAQEASEALAQGADLLILRPFNGSPIPHPKGILRALEDDFLEKENPQQQ